VPSGSTRQTPPDCRLDYTPDERDQILTTCDTHDLAAVVHPLVSQGVADVLGIA
jgi:hypothetical protein